MSLTVRAMWCSGCSGKPYEKNTIHHSRKAIFLRVFLFYPNVERNRMPRGGIGHGNKYAASCGAGDPGNARSGAWRDHLHGDKPFQRGDGHRANPGAVGAGFCFGGIEYDSRSSDSFATPPRRSCLLREPFHVAAALQGTPDGIRKAVATVRIPPLGGRLRSNQGG